MNFKIDMAAGEFFDLIRPVVLVLSALLSTWVFSSARKNGFRVYATVVWTLGTLLFPPAFFPLFLIARFLKRRRTTSYAALVPHRFAYPALYLLAVLATISLYRYHDLNSVDAHLARAAEAKVRGERKQAIHEYRRALDLEDNPHTRKLLAIELSETGRLRDAISEFRLAENGGEPDESIPFRIGIALDALNLQNQAGLEYERFLETNACTQEFPDQRCAGAQSRLSVIRSERRSY